jgi:hypothetical protein
MFQQDTALVQWLYTIQEDRMATKRQHPIPFFQEEIQM